MGQIWLDQVNCRGAESRLIDCPSNILGDHDCSHFEDIGLTCEQSDSKSSQGGRGVIT